MGKPRQRQTLIASFRYSVCCSAIANTRDAHGEQERDAEDVRQGSVRFKLAIDVLEAVGFADEELGVTQIAERLHVTKGSVHRHLHTLVERGYLAQNPATSRYAIGPKSRLLARLAPDTDLVQLAEGPMRELRDALGHTRRALGDDAARRAGARQALQHLADRDRRAPGQRTDLSCLGAGQGDARLRAASVPATCAGAPARNIHRQDDQLSRADREDIASRWPNAAMPRRRRRRCSASMRWRRRSSTAMMPASPRSPSSVRFSFFPSEPKPADVTALKNAAQQISRKLGHGRLSEMHLLDRRTAR